MSPGHPAGSYPARRGRSSRRSLDDNRGAAPEQGFTITTAGERRRVSIDFDFDDLSATGPGVPEYAVRSHPWSARRTLATFVHFVARRVREYRDAPPTWNAKRPKSPEAPEWDGLISIHPDGSVLAMRLLPEAPRR
ncbi:hypothetical protein [Embleya sp. NPDC001921]